MSGVATAIAGAAVVGYAASTYASQQGADAMRSAANSANDEQQGMYDQTRADQAPYRQAGYQALSQMQDPSFQQTFHAGDLTQDPGYQFRMQQGNEAIQRSAAARGGLSSDATLQSMTRFAQGTASDEYQNAYNRFNNDQSTRFNRLASISGLGQTANGQTAASGQNAANQIGSNDLGAGNAQAAAGISQANSMSNLASTGANTWMNYSMMNRVFPQQQAPPSNYASTPTDGFTF